jgi:hypothetical protein
VKSPQFRRIRALFSALHRCSGCAEDAQVLLARPFVTCKLALQRLCFRF